MADIRSKFRREWEALNPILRRGELGFDKTSGRMKIGNGRTPWNDLGYVSSGGGEGTVVLPSYLEEDALRETFGEAGESAQTVVASLPNLMRTLRTYNDAIAPPLRVVGFGSSVGVGATLPAPVTQAPVAHFAARLDDAVNALGNLNLVVTNGSVNGSVTIDFTISNAYAAAKTAAGGPPTIALFCYGMNDGFIGAYHQGQTLDGFYTELKRDVQMVLDDGGDAIIVTTPHPHTGRVDWTDAVSPISYPPGGTAVPAFTAADSVVTADWLGDGHQVPASYRHIRINQIMRAVAAELGVPLIDAERYWFKAVAERGQDALFDTNEFAHPNLLGHQLSYWKAIDDFTTGLTSARIYAAVPRPTRQVYAVKDSNAARTATTTLTDDPQLAFPVGAGQVWAVEADVYFTEGGGDLRVGFNLPPGSTGSAAVIGAGNTATNFGADTATVRRVGLPDNYGLPVGGNGADASVRVTALLRIGSTSGAVTMQFCQDNSSANATTIYADSLLRATRIV